MNRLAERTYEKTVKLARDSKTVIVFLPGAIEEHDPHLPRLVDWLGAEKLARVIAPYLRRAGWQPVLVPSMPYGASPLAADWSGTVSLSTGTLRRAVGEIIRGPARHGFRRFVLTNYQADPGHLRAMALIKRSAEKAAGCRCSSPLSPRATRMRPWSIPSVTYLPGCTGSLTLYNPLPPSFPDHLVRLEKLLKLLAGPRRIVATGPP